MSQEKISGKWSIVEKYPYIYHLIPFNLVAMYRHVLMYTIGMKVSPSSNTSLLNIKFRSNLLSATPTTSPVLQSWTSIIIVFQFHLISHQIIISQMMVKAFDCELYLIGFTEGVLRAPNQERIWDRKVIGFCAFMTSPATGALKVSL